LAQNDVVYVEPNKTKINGAAIGPKYGVIISITSILITDYLNNYYNKIIFCMENNDFDDEYENDFDLKAFQQVFDSLAMVCIGNLYWLIGFILKIYNTAILLQQF
jgi:hypothetical protein